MVCYVRFDVAKLDELLVKPPTAWRAEKISENKRNELKIYVQLNDVSSCENNGKNEEKFSSDYFKVWRNSIRKWNYSFSVFRVSEFVFVEHTHTHTCADIVPEEECNKVEIFYGCKWRRRLVLIESVGRRE